MVRRTLTSVAACLAVRLPAAARAGSAEDFQRAKNAFTFGDYALAVQVLDGLMNPRVMLERTGDIHEALELLGIASYYEDARPRSREAFVRLLSLAPDHRLDPLLVRPEVVDFFESIRSELSEKLDELRRKRSLQAAWEDEARRRAEAPEQIVRREIETPYLLNFVPFGAPQFHYGSPGWGSFFLASQLATAATSMGAFVWGSTRTTTPEDRQFYDEEVAPLQVGAAVTWAALVTWGVIDALVDWPGTTRVVEERRPPPAPTPPPP